jgi:NTE family protein
MHEVGILAEATQVSSVSAGSLTAAVVAMQWDRIRRDLVTGVDASGRHDTTCYRRLVAQPLMALANDTIDVEAALGKLFVPGADNATLESFYMEKLFANRALESIPARPVFRFNATNLQTGAVFSFFRNEVKDDSIGTLEGTGRIRIATAVAASSAFPPFLSPVVVPLGTKAWIDPAPPAAKLQAVQRRGARIASDQYAAFRDKVILVDGGVADNLGLESIWNDKGRFIISDGGGLTTAESNPSTNFLSQSARVMGLIYDQPSALRAKTFNERRREDAESLPASDRQKVAQANRSDRGMVAYWSIADVPDADAPGCVSPVDPKEVRRLSQIDTRLQQLTESDKKRLINWGYHAADYSLAAMAAADNRSYLHSLRLPFPEENILLPGASAANCSVAQR